jgi:hypothetical protein
MTDRNFNAVGWGLFFIWIGICYLAGISFAVGILGVGIILLGVQLARKLSNVKSETFWVVVGILFVIGGIWDLLKIQFDLVPILILIAGVLLLISAFTGKKSTEENKQ